MKLEIKSSKFILFEGCCREGRIVIDVANEGSEFKEAYLKS